MNTNFARSLRHNATDAEGRLWRRLRARGLDGFKFRRQVPMGTYVADFVCFEARVVVEVDGGQHDANSAYDDRRTAWLESQGFKVVRFRNNEVLDNPDTVLEVIRRELSARACTPHPNPLPQGERVQDSDAAVLSSPSSLMGEGRGKGEQRIPRALNGFALVTALIFLLVITLLGVSLFLGVNLQQKAAGNTLQKTRALELAGSATMAAERWLAGFQSPPNLGTCAGNPSTIFRTCYRPPATPNQPGNWMSDATPIYFADLDVGQKGGTDVYYKKPGVWITNLGRATFGAHGYLYQIDAYAWGGNAKSLVVTQTVFYVGGSTKGSTPATDLSP